VHNVNEGTAEEIVLLVVSHNDVSGVVIASWWSLRCPTPEKLVVLLDAWHGAGEW